MKTEFPGAVPEIPVSYLATALAYYESRLGFSSDWAIKEMAAPPVSPKGTAGCS